MLPLLVALGAASAAAQMPSPTAPCLEGTAEGTLTGADVRAALFTNGNLFFGGATNAYGYVVPIESGKSPVYAGMFWLAGAVGGEVRSAASHYGPFAYRPGRTGPDGTAPTPDECGAADRVWTVAAADVYTYAATGVAAPDLAAWPVALGAPVVDGDGVPDNYNLAGGDRPALSGDETAFWAMTDAATPADGEFRPGPLGVDVTVEAFAFRLAPEPIETATFYRYTVTNRGPTAIDSLHAGFFLDFDLGYANDDYVGSDSTLSMAFAYNGDEADDGDATGYGDAPPAVGLVVLGSPDGPDGRPLGLTSFRREVDFPNGVFDTPYRPREQLYALSGRWADGTPQTEGGGGWPPSGVPAPLAYPGDPVAGAYWSMENLDGSGAVELPNEQSVYLGTGPVRLAPDSSAVFLYGIVYGRGASRLASVSALRDAARTAHAAREVGLLDARALALPEPPEPAPFGVRRPSPNPFSGEAELQFVSVPDGLPLTVRVVDVLGREVERREVPAGTSAVRVGAGLAPGVYVVEVAGVGVAVPFRVVKAR